MEVLITENRKIRLDEYIFIIIGFLLVVVYVLFSSGAIFKDLSNPLSNVLFTILNLLATVYIAFKISYFSFLEQNLENQKKLAKTSVRHIRTYLANIQRLIMIVEGKYSNVTDDIYKQYFSEIQNHLENVKNGIISSESDFKDLVQQEYKEESEALSKISEDISKIHNMQLELKQVQEKQEKSTYDNVQKLKDDMSKVRTEINNNLNKLPFGYTSTGVITVDSNSFSNWPENVIITANEKITGDFFRTAEVITFPSETLNDKD